MALETCTIVVSYFIVAIDSIRQAFINSSWIFCVEDQMRPLIYSDDVIEAMVDTMCSGAVSGFDKDIYREALRGLVRLGQAEQLLSMQIDFNTMTTGSVMGHDRH